MQTSRSTGLQIAALVLLLSIPGLSPAEESPDPKAFEIQWKNGLKIERNDGFHQIQIGGRSFLDFASVNASQGLAAQFPGATVVTGDGVEFRAARLFVSGTLYERVVFKTEYDFADSTNALKDVYLGLQQIPWLGELRVGHFYEPFSVEQMGSSRFTTFMERALPVAFSPGRNVGIDVANTAAGDRIAWAVGAFRDTSDNGLGFDNDDAYNLTGRIAGLPFYADEGAKLLHLGASYSHQFREADRSAARQRYRERPEAHLAQRFVDTGSAGIAADGVDLVNASVAGVFGAGSLQSEYTLASVDTSSGDRPMLWGAYAEASWFLTGEHREYDKKKGAFTRVKPARNFDPSKGDWGAWQIAARYSVLDLDDEAVQGGRMQDATAGLNWYLFPNIRLMANYIYSDVEDAGHANIYQMRAQIDF